MKSLLMSRSVRGTAAVLTLTLVMVLVGAVSASAVTQFGTYGHEAGQTTAAIGVAVNASGDVYVGDMVNNERVDEFDSAGNWLLAWGAGVLNGANEMQTCTTTCTTGSQTSAKEAFELPSGVAVDNDPISASYGDVYVVDTRHNRVEKFHPEEGGGKTVMKFVLMFGGKVNEANGEDICRAGEKCKLSAETGSKDGEFTYMQEQAPGQYGFGSFIAVGPGGAIYVGDRARVEVFEPSGAWKETISLAALSSEAHPTALAVDGSGDVFVKDAGIAGVHEFAPNGIETSAKFDENSTTVTALAVDASTNHLFIGDSSGGFHIDEYDRGGRELASFKAEAGTGQNLGLAFSSTTGDLYVTEAHIGYGEPAQSGIWTITPPSLAPQIDGTSVTPEPRGSASLEADVNPEGNETTVRFEYVDEVHFQESGYANAKSTQSITIGSSPTFEDKLVTAHVTLTPGTSYHYRVLASSSAGSTISQDQSFLETPPVLIALPAVSDVAGTSVTISTEIDPLGANTTYKLEYGTSASYGQSVGGSLGEGTANIAVTRHLQELQPATTYHFRIIATNEIGSWQTADRTFTTQSSGSGPTLPDGRAWELVSPADKHGALIEPELLATWVGGMVQAAQDGSGVAYTASVPVAESVSGFASYATQVLTRRGAHGWQSQEVMFPQRLSEEEGKEAPTLRTELPSLFSQDLSIALMEPWDIASPLSPEAAEQTLYLHNNVSGDYQPLLTKGNVRPGTDFGGTQQTHPQIKYLFATPDLAHVIFESPLALTEYAAPAECKPISKGAPVCGENLYEWSAGQLQLVNVLPNGKVFAPSSEEVGLGRYAGDGNDTVHYAASLDGRFVVWSYGAISEDPKVPHTMYVRDMVRGVTTKFGGSYARFVAIGADGSRIIYWEKGDLYAFDMSTDATTDVTDHHGAGETDAGVIDNWWMGPSEDASYMYFVATGVLAANGVPGEDNLYVAHFDGSQWRVTYIATLAKDDQFYSHAVQSQITLDLLYADSRVSPNGRYLAFMSNRSLTGYDNRDTVSGRADEEVYLYDAAANRLVCASCNPTNEQPTGVYIPEYGYEYENPMDARKSSWPGHGLAALIPGWRVSKFIAQYQQRFLSDSGRLFFDGFDSLVSHDTNGTADVYEYEPVGVGGCTAMSGAYTERSLGCVSLISSGTSAGESGFLDASENGDDVFFVTASKLTSEDYDSGNDVYDAHVCSSAVPCLQQATSPPPCTSGDSCKAAPSLQPEIFGPAPSATFSGTGNVSEAWTRHVRSRSLTRAQKLARALRACAHVRPTRRRLTCQRHAQKRFGRTTSLRKLKTGKKGKR